jgi:hypothetical protein
LLLSLGHRCAPYNRYAFFVCTLMLASARLADLTLTIVAKGVRENSIVDSRPLSRVELRLQEQSVAYAIPAPALSVPDISISVPDMLISVLATKLDRTETAFGPEASIGPELRNWTTSCNERRCVRSIPHGAIVRVFEPHVRGRLARVAAHGKIRRGTHSPRVAAGTTSMTRTQSGGWLNSGIAAAATTRAVLGDTPGDLIRGSLMGAS